MIEGIRIRYAMQSELVRHVGHFVLLVGLVRDGLKRTVFVIVERPGITRFVEGALEDFHDAVGVCVAVSCKLNQTVVMTR